MYFFYLCLRIIIYPLIRYFLPLFSKKVHLRMEFELKNIHEHKPFDKADIGFEISSQGELEQVKVLIINTLEMNKNVELIFCSPSVEQECIALREKYPENLALYRMPLICFHPLLRHFNPKKWLTCQTFIMCRYDFFPSLINFGKSCDQFILLAGTLKNFESKNFLARAYLYNTYNSFTKVVTSHSSDKARFANLLGIPHNNIRVHDFRIDQILWRLESAQTNVKKKLGESYRVIEYLESLKPSQKCIFGSLWPEEVSLFKNMKNEIDPKSILVFPHKLGKIDIELLLDQMNKFDLCYSFVDEKTTKEEIDNMIAINQEQNHIYIFNFKGILCEMYSFFNYAYVGGGFGESVHSLLEPYLARNYVFCGPKVQRSTEYTFIKEIGPNVVMSIEKIEEIIFAIFEQMNEDESIESIPLNERNEKFRELLEWLKIVK